MPEHVDVTILPPADLLPEPVRPLLEARDDAYDRWVDFESEHHALLSDQWEDTYEARDILAAAEAVTAGKDPLKIKSELAEARDLRPRIVGAARALVKDVRAKDAALAAAFRKHVGELAPAAAQRLQEAAKAYQEAYGALMAARAVFGAAADFRRYVYAWQGSGRPDYYESAGVVRADGLSPQAAPGLQEVREVLESFRTAGLSDDGLTDRAPDRLVRVRSKANGAVMHLAADQAAALGNSIEYVDQEDTPDAPATDDIADSTSGA